MRFLRGIGLLMVAVGAASSGFAGDVDVTTYSAHDELYGIVVTVDGKGDKAYIENLHPNAEKTYRVDFWFHPGDMNLEEKKAHIIFQAVGAKTGGRNGDAKIVEVELRQKPKNKMVVRAISFSDAQPKQKRVKTKIMRIDETGWNHLLLEWQASSDNSAPDGFTRLSIIGGLRSGPEVEISGRVADQEHAVEKQRLGAIRGVDATTHGSCYFDTFGSYRTLMPQ